MTRISDMRPSEIDALPLPELKAWETRLLVELTDLHNLRVTPGVVDVQRHEDHIVHELASLKWRLLLSDPERLIPVLEQRGRIWS